MTKPVDIEFDAGHLHRAVVFLKRIGECRFDEDPKLMESLKALRMVHGELCRHGRVTLNSTGRNDNPKPRPPYKRKLIIPMEDKK